MEEEKGEAMEDQTGDNRETTRIAWRYCVMRLKDWTEIVSETNGEATVQTCTGWTIGPSTKKESTKLQ
jgi:hypothetical protein